MAKEKIEKEVEETVVEQDIEVNDPRVLRPTELPLVVKLPEGASLAQIEFAKILNAYAYTNPEKWAEKKDDKVVGGNIVKGLITKLRDLKDAPGPASNSKVKINNSLM